MSLQRKAYQGAGWSGLSGLITNGLELLKYVVLARILLPGDFGLLAMAMVIISIGRIFADGGTSNAVIHYRDQSHRQLSTLFWINIVAGFSLYLIIFLGAPFIAVFYGEPEVLSLLRVGGLILPVYASGALYEVMLRKTLSFKYITLSEAFGAALGFITAIVLAFAGWGVWSLVWSHIITASTLTLFYIINGIRSWRPGLIFSTGEVRSHLGFGLFQMGERGLNVYTMRIDQLIIGRFFGADVLGAYYLAYQIVLFPVARLSPLLNRVAFPVFSSRQDDDAILRNGYLKLMQAIISLNTPLFLLAALTAPWLVPLLFGGGWELVVTLIPLMAVVGILRMLGNPSGNIVLAKGRARLVFFWNLVVAVASTIVFLIGAQYSIFMLLWLFIGANVIYFALGQWLLVNRLIGLPWLRFWGSLTPSLIVLAVCWLICWFYRGFADGIHNMNELLMVISIATLFLIVYLPLIWQLQSGLIREVSSAFYQKEGGKNRVQL